jgi:hypothetical protein
MIKFAQYTQQIEECLSEVEMEQVSLMNVTDENELVKELSKSLSQNTVFKAVLHQWL